MSTPSTGAASSRDLRDRPLGRLALIGAVLVLAFLAARGCQASDEVSSQRAVELARSEATFVPERTQVRLVQRGIPPRAFWAVSLYDVDENGNPTRVLVYLVDRSTGDVTRG